MAPNSAIAKLLQDQARQSAETLELQNAVRGTIADINGLTSAMEAQSETLTALNGTVSKMQTGMEAILEQLQKRNANSAGSASS